MTLAPSGRHDPRGRKPDVHPKSIAPYSRFFFTLVVALSLIPKADTKGLRENNYSFCGRIIPTEQIAMNI
jgi:hypothetical protein